VRNGSTAIRFCIEREAADGQCRPFEQTGLWQPDEAIRLLVTRRPAPKPRTGPTGRRPAQLSAVPVGILPFSAPRVLDCPSSCTISGRGQARYQDGTAPLMSLTAGSSVSTARRAASPLGLELAGLELRAHLQVWPRRQVARLDLIAVTCAFGSLIPSPFLSTGSATRLHLLQFHGLVQRSDRR